MVAEGAFVPHTPDPKLWGMTIVCAVRLDYSGEMSKKDQQRPIDANPETNTEAPVFYVGQTWDPVVWSASGWPLTRQLSARWSNPQLLPGVPTATLKG